MTPSVDYIYWAFSAAAQSISAFVAFLLTGYALVHSLMESARERDDTLEEVHTTLRKAYHRQLKVLAWLTGAAIVLSLALAYANRPTSPVPAWAQVLVALLDIAALIGGLHFVVSIVDPAKYQRAATQELRQVLVPAASRAPSSEFFSAFLHLERLVRDYLRARDLYVPSRGAPRMSYSFRQMIDALRSNEKIGPDLYNELLEVNKYRNLVFHGHVTEVDSHMLERTRMVAARIQELQ